MHHAIVTAMIIKLLLKLTLASNEKWHLTSSIWKTCFSLSRREENENFNFKVHEEKKSYKTEKPLVLSEASLCGNFMQFFFSCNSFHLDEFLLADNLKSDVLNVKGSSR
jgi:hypothetical protein